MGTINLVNSLVGGTGKSVFCSLLYEYFGQPHVNTEVDLIDTDRNNPDVGRKYFPKEYSDCPKLYFSENPKDVDKSNLIYKKAESGNVLINFSSSSLMPLDNWLLSNQILDYKAINVVNWFVSDGSYKSIQVFKDFVNKYKFSMTHVLVKNNINTRGWVIEEKDDLELSNLIDFYEIQLVQIPYFHDLRKIEYLNIPFLDLIESDKLKAMECQRTKIFLEESFEAISKIDPFNFLRSKLESSL